MHKQNRSVHSRFKHYSSLHPPCSRLKKVQVLSEAPHQHYPHQYSAQLNQPNKQLICPLPTQQSSQHLQHLPPQNPPKPAPRLQPPFLHICMIFPPTRRLHPYYFPPSSPSTLRIYSTGKWGGGNAAATNRPRPSNCSAGTNSHTVSPRPRYHSGYYKKTQSGRRAWCIRNVGMSWPSLEASRPASSAIWSYVIWEKFAVSLSSRNSSQ